MSDEEMKPCPFCGGPAMIEECSSVSVNPNAVSFSPGCNNPKIEDCPGYQLLQNYSRRSDAIKAWNRRA